MSTWEKVGDGCSCLVNPNPFTHYGIAEPGDELDPDPRCKKHFPRWQVACINWGTEDAPKALTYCLVYGEAKAERFHATWDDANEWIRAHRDHLALWAKRLGEIAREAS